MRRTGWVLIGVAVLALGMWVAVRAWAAPSNDEGTFEWWVGWANILALTVGGLGVALVAFDKAAQRGTAARPRRPARSTRP